LLWHFYYRTSDLMETADYMGKLYRNYRHISQADQITHDQIDRGRESSYQNRIYVT
jgi:hypothetical protein